MQLPLSVKIYVTYSQQKPIKVLDSNPAISNEVEGECERTDGSNHRMICCVHHELNIIVIVRTRQVIGLYLCPN